MGQPTPPQAFREKRPPSFILDGLSHGEPLKPRLQGSCVNEKSRHSRAVGLQHACATSLCGMGCEERRHSWA